MGQEHPEVYRRLKTRYQTERNWIEERTEAIDEQMTRLDRETEAVRSWKNIKEKYFSRIDELTDSEWRELFIALNIVIPIGEDKGTQSADIRLSSPDATISYYQGKRDFEELLNNRPSSANIEVRVGLSLDDSYEPVTDIVFKAPLLFTPLSSQEEFSFILNGSGWRGVRGEVLNSLELYRSLCK